MSCTEIPKILVSGRDSCKQVTSRYPNCKCESETVCPEHSPGVIGADEILARFVIREWWDEATGQVVSAAFAHAAQKGMSTTRTRYCTHSELAAQERSRDDQRAGKRDYIGYVISEAQLVREINSEEQQAFAIYDTAKGPAGTDRAHADVCQSVFRPGARAIELRRTLQQIFNQSGLCSTRSASESRDFHE